MTKTLTCSQGHHWQVADDVLVRSDLTKLACPMCGSQAETISDATGVHETNKDAQRQSGTPNDPHRLTGYEILDEAGRGGMGVVYRALDRQNDRIVALKTLQRIDPVALQRFKKEFRSLSDVAHRNLVSLYELISDGENWCFTMELIDGVDLLYYVRHGHSDPDPSAVDLTIELSAADLRAAGQPGLSPEQLDRLRDVTAQLAAAISALHAAGILHRDIKPSNVLVTREGRAVVLDFGLAAALDNSNEHRNSQDNVLGTVAYMSPEQAASDTVSHPTDWYALGSLLYEALTGQTPFKGQPLAVLQAKQTEDPPAPSTIWHDVPADLEELCVGLLMRDAAQRATGADVLHVLQQDAPAIGALEAAPDEADHLIGREQPLAALREAYGNVMNGRPANVFVSGESGNGKSTLIKHFLDEIQRDQQAIVLAGRCYERESVPFKAIDSLIDSLVAHLKQLSSAEAEAVMPRDIQALMRLFPVTGRIEANIRLPSRKLEFSDQQELNRRAIGALREMLARMGDRQRLVVYIDDLQWGDEDSAAMLSDLLQSPDAPVLLFLGTYRSEDAETSPFLHAFRQIQGQREVPLESLHIDVKPLAHADAVRLALDLLERDDDDAHSRAAAIADEAAGNPYFISELVKHLQLESDGTTASLKHLAVADMLWFRVQRLPDDAQRLLEVVALWGQPLRLEQAMHIAEVGPSSVGPLRTGHLIRTVGSSSSSIIETYHDRVRETVAEKLDHGKRQSCHLRIAEEYARQSTLDGDQIMECLAAAAPTTNADDQFDVAPIWYDVAFHYDKGGRSDLAFPFALATAEKARRQFSLEVSEQQYQIAERGMADVGVLVQCRVAEGLGDVLMVRGNYEEARVRFNLALKSTPDSGASIEAKLGELAFRQGDMEKTIEISTRVLQLLGHKVPGRSLAVNFWVAREAFVQVLHSFFPRFFVGRKNFTDREKTLLVVRLHNRLTYAYYFEHRELCLWNHLRGLNLAEQYPPTAELGHAYAIHAPVMGLVALYRRGVAYAERSSAIYTSLGDLRGQGLALSFQGVVLFAASRFEECIEKCREAIQLLERAGDLWEVNVARVHTAFCLYKLGELAASAEIAKRVHFSGVELGDAKASGFSLDVWAWSTAGKVPAEILQNELQRPREDIQVRAQVMMAEGVRLFMLDQLEDAAKAFTDGQQLAEAAGLSSTYVLPLRPWLSSALRRQAETLEPERRTAMIKQANKVAATAVRVARKFQNDLPHALREYGLIAAIRGNLRKARACLDESLAVAERQGARFEHAQSLLARGRLGQQHGWPNAEHDCNTAEQELRDMGADFALAAADGTWSENSAAQKTDPTASS